MGGAVVLRDAAPGDAESIAAVLRASIRELFAGDHGGEERALGAWLANKTPDSVRQWLRNPANILVVAEVGGETACVGGLQRDGHVILNYVAPAFRFRGVSKAMMAELERRAAHIGLRELTLESTATAHRFYQALGYADAAEPGAKHGLTNYPMRKAIA